MLTVRFADDSDCREVFDWRNDPLTRQISLQPEAISFDAHKTWFDAALADTKRILLIGLQDSARIGIVRYDLKNDGSALVSINLNPSWRGRGLGCALLTQSEKMLPPGLLHLCAEIKTLNAASIKTFKNAGYTLDRESEKLKTYLKTLT